MWAVFKKQQITPKIIKPVNLFAFCTFIKYIGTLNEKNYNRPISQDTEP